ncbi:hypothetical protein DBT_0148 [Dissulfuribacter thermophilus]|uniref:Mobile element protein n=1 Tax=Dissulfuribacter thermophilus TaxID=1156395 RepID=A0A1B9F974_9BACT|nr:hypothetical protein DBT_0148 [Dissulfuribacter thermophilus]
MLDKIRTKHTKNTFEKFPNLIRNLLNVQFIAVPKRTAIDALLAETLLS